MHIWTLGTLAAVLALATAHDIPTAVRRMPADPAEKFYPSYAAYSLSPDFPVPSPLVSRAAIAAAIIDRLPAVAANGTSPNPALGIQPVFRPHDGQVAGKLRRAAEALHVLQGRSSCPTGFLSCEDIGYADKCCLSSETCVKVEDGSTGNVACCPVGSSCSGDVASCPSSAVACPSSLGGGCCISGYACEGSGCVKTVTVTASASTRTTVLATTTTSTSVGTSAVAPFRPTSGSATSSTTSTTTTTTSAATLDNCPTGYYACLAHYGGGCCQTGRDCQEISCAPTSSTNIVSRAGLTIAIAASDTPTTTVAEASASCATGWFLCSASANVVAGCCPDDYACGDVSCTLNSASEMTAVGKKSTVASGGVVRRVEGWMVALGTLMAVAVV